jgi:hypothetical protein
MYHYSSSHPVGYVPLEDSSSHPAGYVPLQLLTLYEVLALKNQEKEE